MATLAAPPDVREKILAAAVQVLRTDGIRLFTQTRVAERAKVRQSHLTYYFPTRADLLEATAERVLDGVTANIAQSSESVPAWGAGQLLGQLAEVMVNDAHMRMFIAMVIEGDGDATVRDLMARGTSRVHTAITQALGGKPSDDRRARVIQVTLWGLGLYTFANQLPPELDPTDDTLNLLEEFAR